MVLDSVRTLLVWGVSLGLGWETFLWPQLVGFAILSFAIATFNEIIKLPGFHYEEEDGKKQQFTGGSDHGSFLADHETAGIEGLLRPSGEDHSRQ